MSPNQTLSVILVLFGYTLVSCKETTQASKPPPKIDMVLLQIIHKPKYGYGKTSSERVLDSNLKGSESFSGISDNPLSISYCYVGKVDLTAPNQQSRSVLVGHVIAVRYSEYDTNAEADTKEIIDYIVYNGKDESQIEVGEMIVKLSPKPYSEQDASSNH